MTKKVNLDAIIPREDFEIDEHRDSSGVNKDRIDINDIAFNSFFFLPLRKPDFQRETNEWDMSKIVQLIESFLDGDLIPSIILWRNPQGTIFVIDGSHRLSALAAWVNDDYGDGDLSKKFYQNKISNEQLEIADETRLYIEKKIHSFKEYKTASRDLSVVDSEMSKRAKNLGSMAIQLQWVRGNADKAEDSFFKINQQASPINKTELLLLKSRRKPNSLATRAIIRSGTGHKYWSKFKKEKQAQIELLAKEINKILFEPRYQTPIKSLDLPIGGNRISSQTLIYDFVNISNNISSQVTLSDDDDGDETIKYLRQCRKLCWIMNSQHGSSLGLHPIIYCYSLEGRFKPASFYAITSLALDMLNDNSFKRKFISVRENFESVLLKYSYLTQQIVQQHKRLAIESLGPIKLFYLELINGLEKKGVSDDLVNNIIKQRKFSRLKIKDEDEESIHKDFSSDIKSKTFILKSITTLSKCTICKGFLHKNSISIDHIVRKREGGKGNLDNADLSHPYCNSTIKN